MYVIKAYFYNGDMLKMKTPRAGKIMDREPGWDHDNPAEHRRAVRYAKERRRKAVENFKVPEVERIEWFREGSTDIHVEREP